MTRIPILALLLAGASPALAETTYPPDPLHSPMWTAHAKALFGDDAVRFDPRVKVSFPAIAENQRAFPGAIDARGPRGARKRSCYRGWTADPAPRARDPAISYADTLVRVRTRSSTTEGSASVLVSPSA